MTTQITKERKIELIAQAENIHRQAFKLYCDLGEAEVGVKIDSQVAKISQLLNKIVKDLKALEVNK